MSTSILINHWHSYSFRPTCTFQWLFRGSSNNLLLGKGWCFCLFVVLFCFVCFSLACFCLFVCLFFWFCFVLFLIVWGLGGGGGGIFAHGQKKIVRVGLFNKRNSNSWTHTKTNKQKTKQKQANKQTNNTPPPKKKSKDPPPSPEEKGKSWALGKPE